MQNTIYPFVLNLQLFAEGAGSGTGAGAAEGTAGVNATVAAPQTEKGVKGNSLADVQYGIMQEKDNVPAAGEQQLSREEAFEKLIKGDYKDLYDAKMQDTIQKRLKSTRETVDAFEKASPILELLAKKHGVDAKDMDALAKAIEEDDSYFEEEALKRGLTVKQYKEVRKMEQENAELRAFKQQQQNQENADRLSAAWIKQAESAKQFYPSFDLKTELMNPKFTDLLKANIDVKTAFEVLHKDEIIPAAMQYTAQEVERKLVNKVMAGGMRPAENGTGAQASAIVKNDVSKLTRADMDEVARRVARGEKITFGNTPIR
ncbi:MAG: hypothetical protein IJ306_01155 [Oscillospiraceae bacterium]|nr:hypothetical protein [Oscillospiraceae bacterium]